MCWSLDKFYKFSRVGMLLLWICGDIVSVCHLQRSLNLFSLSLCFAQMNDIIATVRDSNLKLTLAFGIGMHHAGLHERDRKTVEELFVNCKIQVCFSWRLPCYWLEDLSFFSLAISFQIFQVLIATSTLAWGVNFPAHLVIVKGTEFYDGKTRRYVDYPITGTVQGHTYVLT